MESRYQTALHSFEINLLKADAPAGHEFVFVGGLALDLVATCDEFLYEGGLFVFGELSPFEIFGDANEFDKSLPEATRNLLEDFSFNLCLTIAEPVKLFV